MQNTSNEKMYQVSTLNALVLGYTREVISVGELLSHGDTGLGTFVGVNGEMIVVDGHCYKAANDGSATEVPADAGVPFAGVSFLQGHKTFDVRDISDIDQLKLLLDKTIDHDFELNSMHLLRIDGEFTKVSARSESGLQADHIELKEILRGNQKSFIFENLEGSLVALYFPDYMQGMNAAGWHFHFISADRKLGGHVFDVSIKQGVAKLDKISQMELQLPTEASFDTYELGEASRNDIKEVEQGKNK